MSLTAERLRELLHYDQETGVFIWLRPKRQNMVGVRAGWAHQGLCRCISIDGVKYKEHRLAWLYVHGEFPAGWIDHKDRNPFNNSLANLRLCNASQNMANSCFRVGIKGVRWHKRDKVWEARIRHYGRYLHLGSFQTQDAAQFAYNEAAVKIHGEFAFVPEVAA